VIQTEWIEHSGKFERAYRIHSPETNKPSYLLIEFQIEREDEELPRRLLANYATVNGYAAKDVRQEDNAVEDEDENIILHQEYYVYPEVLCPFPHAVPAPIKDTFDGQVMLEFNFQTLRLWEKDAREFLNTHISVTYFLLPAMKNADAFLLGLAISRDGAGPIRPTIARGGTRTDARPIPTVGMLFYYSVGHLRGLLRQPP
jgi:hypothetical protein